LGTVNDAQLELGAVRTAYQLVGATTYDVTEAGQADNYFLWFDGIDDSMVTPTITPGIDKVQVFAGVRKLGFGLALLAETSTSNATNAGSFFVAAPEFGTLQYSALARGSTTAAAAQRASITAAGVAPDNAVLTTTHDIAGDLSTIRRNAVAGTNGTGEKGTGNFLAYPMYIGSRGGTSLFFNGQLYSLITRFGANLDANVITQTETYVAGKTAGVEL
jgi:hypothetical protein